MAESVEQMKQQQRGVPAFRRSVDLVGSAVLLAVMATSTVLATREDLARARSLYNARQFDAAIEAATVARETPATRDAGAVVLARAYLERYRERVDPADLGLAREALGSIRAEALGDRDRVELLLTLGQALFLEDEFGASAAVFASGLDLALVLDPDLSSAMLDWWGSAIERTADGLPRDARVALFGMLGERMERELARDPGSEPAGYWSAVAARGSGDPQTAWDAAVAGWVRARLAGQRSAMLRADLDRLIIRGIIPDRVKQLPASERDTRESQLRADWELVKERWK